jgi:hypothetical protein
MAAVNSTVTFRDIPGFPGYRVGDDGSVWSCYRRSKFAGPRTLDGPWVQLRLKKQRSGHLVIRLSDASGRRRWHSVHHLVLYAFVGPRPPGKEACHFPDRNPANNHLNNLRWDTKKANHADAVVHGTLGEGENSPRAKLTNAKVRELRREYAAGGTSHSRLARKYGLTDGAIGFILNGQTWKNPEAQIDYAPANGSTSASGPRIKSGGMP